MPNLSSIGYEPSPPPQVCGCFFAVAGFVVGPFVALMINVSLDVRHQLPHSCGMGGIVIMAYGAILGFYLGSIAGRILGDFIKRRGMNAPPPPLLSTGFRIAPLGAIGGVFFGSLLWSSLGYPGSIEFGDGFTRTIVIASATIGGTTSFMFARLVVLRAHRRFHSTFEDAPEFESD